MNPSSPPPVHAVVHTPPTPAQAAPAQVPVHDMVASLWVYPRDLEAHARASEPPSANVMPANLLEPPVHAIVHTPRVGSQSPGQTPVHVAPPSTVPYDAAMVLHEAVSSPSTRTSLAPLEPPVHEIVQIVPPIAGTVGAADGARVGAVGAGVLSQQGQCTNPPVVWSRCGQHSVPAAKPIAAHRGCTEQSAAVGARVGAVGAGVAHSAVHVEPCTTAAATPRLHASALDPSVIVLAGADPPVHVIEHVQPPQSPAQAPSHVEAYTLVRGAQVDASPNTCPVLA
jgi:hypothetical protein